MSTSPPLQTPATRGTVVLLHASASSARQWDRLADALRGTLEVHAIELHGHGSRPPWSGARPPSLHDDAAPALEVLERAGGGHVIGHSYGGAVAMHLAAARPALVHSLAVYEPVLLHLLADHAAANVGALEVFAVAAQIRRRNALGDGAGAAECFVDYWSGPGTWQRMGPQQQRAVVSRMATVVAHFEMLLGEPLPPSMPRRLTMPLLVMHGTRSTHAARVLAELLQRLLPDAEHVAMPGLGHMGPVTDPAGVNDRLLRFLHVATPRRPVAAEAVA
jgi:pimeloyl-ACP methyl ester carboxylesterase